MDEALSILERRVWEAQCGEAVHELANLLPDLRRNRRQRVFDLGRHAQVRSRTGPEPVRVRVALDRRHEGVAKPGQGGSLGFIEDASRDCHCLSSYKAVEFSAMMPRC